jgi:ELWxxDGT repeat protein
VDGKLYFSDGYRLWRSDGTFEGTVKLRDLVGGNFPLQVSPPGAVIPAGLLFSSPLADGTLELRLAAGTLPAAPDTFTATVPGGVQLTWADRAANESGFVIERSKRSDFATIDAEFFVGPDITSYLDTAAPAGDLYYRIRAVNAAGSSAFSNVVQAVDNVGPLVTAGTFDYLTSQRFTLTFSDEIVIDQLTFGTSQIALTSPGSAAYFATLVTSNRGARTATFSTGSVRLPDGNYRAMVIPDGLHDVAGNPMASLQGFDFFVLAGDANRDRSVGPGDFNLLASNFGKSGQTQTWATGDFDYDGVVGPGDFNILASRFGTTLAPPPPPPAPLELAAVLMTANEPLLPTPAGSRGVQRTTAKHGEATTTVLSTPPSRSPTPSGARVPRTVRRLPS